MIYGEDDDPEYREYVSTLLEILAVYATVRLKLGPTRIGFNPS